MFVELLKNKAERKILKASRFKGRKSERDYLKRSYPLRAERKLWPT